MLRAVQRTGKGGKATESKKAILCKRLVCDKLKAKKRDWFKSHGTAVEVTAQDVYWKNY